jgi:clan AA aspartic protease
MITGVVHVNLDAVIPLAVRDAAGVMRQMDAVIDTGFTGFLTLPTAEMAALGLTWLSREQGVLADGSTRLFDVYRGAAVMWDGQLRSVTAEAIDAAPLVGMELLQGHELRIRVIVGGSVVVEAVP